MYILYPTYVLRIADSAYIPLSTENRDYNAYLEWAETNTASAPAPEVKPVPLSVTPRQARLVLLKLGKLDQVDEFIANLPDIQKAAAKIEWEYSLTYSRTSPLVLLLGHALGLSETELDELFIAASEL